MRRHKRTALSAVTALAVAVVLGACGSSSKTTTTTTPAATGTGTTTTPATGGGATGTVTETMGTAPDYLDPNLSYTSQGWEIQYNMYTGLLTYAHANGTAGAKIIPGLATALPTITDSGKTYTMTLRKGLVFSNGKPVKASDFVWTLQRVIKLPWGGSGSFLNAQIVGANAYATGKAKTISGVTADDATGKITIHLVAPYGALENVLAIPPLGLVPSGTPLKNQSASPPPGVGPYMYGKINPNVSVQVVKNPEWSKMNIPGIPAGNVNVTVNFNSNVAAGALSVLNNSTDVFDWADIIPGSVLQQVRTQAADRFSKAILNTTYYFFLNSAVKPFNNQLAREAVIEGLDRQALVRLGAGFWTPACYLLPPNMVGHPTAPCPYGDPAAAPNIAKAKALVQQSGMAGAPVTVWGQERQPRRQFIDYYTSMLNQIGFHATEKIIADADYFPTIGDLKQHPQTGFADWNQDFPNPIDFYGILLAGNAILPTNNQNFGEVNDKHINGEVATLGKVATTDLPSSAQSWQALDQYTAQHAYIGVWGYLTAPVFTSTRIDRTAMIFSPLFGFDYSSFKTK
jgi:peptide/nickel transport system substrate-binding protein